MFLVTGKSKASTLREVLYGVRQPELYPAQRIHPGDGQVTWLVDEAAGSKL
jgi:6-phosphogluconolactonase